MCINYAGAGGPGGPLRAPNHDTILANRCRNGTAKRPSPGYMVNHVQPSHEGLVMKKISIAGALVSGAMRGALAVGSAMAADMPVKPPYLKAPPPMAYSWTGCYINA